MEKKQLSAGQWILLILAGLFVLGLLAGGASSSGTTGGTSNYTPTKSAWCKQHEDDEWSGRMDSTTKRYFAECV